MLFTLTYTPNHFSPDELVPKAVFEAAESLAKILFPAFPEAQKDYIEFAIFSLFEPDILRSIDWLREIYGPCIINNWKRGGPFQFRGLRQPESEYYRVGSMHSLTADRLVGACDCSFTTTSAEAIRQDLRKRESQGEKFFFTRVEDNVNWLHVDVKKTGKDQLVFFKP